MGPVNLTGPYFYYFFIFSEILRLQLYKVMLTRIDKKQRYLLFFKLFYLISGTFFLEK